MGLSEALSSDERTQQILDAALTLILRQGYDKTSIGDVAAEAGISRGTVYLYFASKEQLVEALVLRESIYYGKAWLEFIERDESASVGAIYRAVLYAIDQRPLLAALLKRDRRMIGSYLRKPGSLFASLEAMSIWDDLLVELQAAGAVRQDVDTAIMTHIMDMLSYGFISVDDFKPAESIPPLSATLAAVAAMLDGALTPPDGGNRDAARTIIQRRAALTRTQFEAFLREWESTRTR